MNTSNEDRTQPDNMEILKQQSQCCGAGCDCHGGAAPGKMRWIICGIVLIAAGVLVVRAMTKQGDAANAASEPAFAMPLAVASATSPAAPAASSSADPAAPPTDAADDGAPAEPAAADGKPAATSAASIIGSFAELNIAAATTDAVFVYLPAKSSSDRPPIPTIEAAVRTMQSRGVKCGIFALKAGSPDYDQVATQMALPGVLAMVKGKGMRAVSGEITEAKLIQGYVAAANSSGCGSGGCGPGGCP